MTKSVVIIITHKFNYEILRHVLHLIMKIRDGLFILMLLQILKLCKQNRSQEKYKLKVKIQPGDKVLSNLLRCDKKGC